MDNFEPVTEECIQLLQELISIPSFSKKEEETATAISKFLIKKEIDFERFGNNIIAYAKSFDATKPTVWLNSHHDTVKPNKAYTRDPFSPDIEDGKLFGLGSNDAGGPLVSLLGAFLILKDKELPFNLIFIASAEEEISGKKGISLVLEHLTEPELVIVGEPTQMKMALAEKGLMVLDCEVIGKPGHAARNEGINAIYLALEDLEKVKNFEFKKVSPYLGKSKVTATIIQAGSQHNVVPDLCTFTLDVRVTDVYTLEEALEELQNSLSAKLVPRSLRLRSSKTPEDHPIIRASAKCGMETFGSPTLSDQALIPYPSVKIGPGDSARSHSADEFIYISEIEKAVVDYVVLLEKYAQIKSE
ncbi:M20/M25/M40 family metallo-hydrolase [Algoriphagus kandeliae]|uniref:M20/M25/M40 family metallo-hydrolase n=1 Tax=Algoriphagus kandeliae TaxID=2562278 RepID=A0A4Y9QZU2_9BACT|nr:M20 family metallo-hydrolase [Algoriphagus kandeliae]TFV97717.1 M20/M25/M40 family metallo-hydrolase [Algoriphagus kandeliae]